MADFQANTVGEEAISYDVGGDEKVAGMCGCGCVLGKGVAFFISIPLTFLNEDTQRAVSVNIIADLWMNRGDT
jgi:hypothetical protein